MMSLELPIIDIIAAHGYNDDVHVRDSQNHS